MKKNYFFLLLFCIFFVTVSHSEAVESDTKVVTVNPDHEFFVIDSGKNAGLEMGDNLVVQRDGEYIGRAYIIEVRPLVAAAEISETRRGEEIRMGDSVFLEERPQKGAVGTVKQAVWTPILAPGREEKPAPLPGPVPEADMESGETREEGSEPEIDYSSLSYIREQSFEIGINAKPDVVFEYMGVILRENGYFITSSNRITGTLVANKPIEMSLLGELWADAVAAIDHKVVASFDIKPSSGSTRVKVTVFKEHTQKQKYVKRAVTSGSRYYNELVRIASMVRDRSER